MNHYSSQETPIQSLYLMVNPYILTHISHVVLSHVDSTSAATEAQQCPVVTTQRQQRCCRGRIGARQRRHARDEARVSVVAMEASQGSHGVPRGAGMRL